MEEVGHKMRNVQLSTPTTARCGEDRSWLFQRKGAFSSSIGDSPAGSATHLFQSTCVRDHYLRNMLSTLGE